ncbi:MAG TPA: efflux RND transporter permease subunit [Candidatus Acidoferrum sp.]|jgi:HAE1 family hydrophobic/amphiphilic exporter-1|nr:efflux RND transporter permease subunit [Candidatus Acidoferrum sp.]
MWLTRLCVQRPTIVFVMLALIAVVGTFAVLTITQQQFPNVDVPVVGVRASYPGGSTTEIRDAIVRPLEDAIAGAPDLSYINTTVQQGQASITASFDLSSNQTTDLVQVQRRVMIAQSQLPSDMPAPTVGTFDPAQATVLTIGLSSSALSPGAMSAIVSNDIVPAMEQVDGVSNVNANGAVTPAFEVQVNPNLLASAGYTLSDVVSTIQSNNNREPGGIAYLPNHETTIDVRGDLTTAQSVENLLISAASSYTTSFGNASYSEPVAAGVPGGVSAASSSETAGVAAGNASSSGSLSSAATASPAPASSSSSTASTNETVVTAVTPPPMLSLPAQSTQPLPSSVPAPYQFSAPQYATASSSSSSANGGGGGGGYSGPSLSNVNPWTYAPRQMRMSDVANVIDSYEPQRQYSYVGTIPTISLSIQKSTGASEVVAADNVLKALPGIEKQYPQIQFQILNNQAAYTEDQIFGVVRTLSEAIFITAIVMLFFLRSWRNAIVILVAIPSSLGVTLGLMRAFNFSIDTISLLAMTLIIGILVDDSIVVLENIERHHASGEEPRDAAIKGRTQIGPAAIVITLVDVVVFLPIAFLPGQVGRFLSEFALVVVTATLTSLFISFTVTPSLAGNWSLFSKWKPPNIVDRFTNLFERTRMWYAHTALPWALDRPRLVVIASFGAVFAVMALIPLHIIGFEFMPPVDRGEVFVQLTYPTGTPLAFVNQKISALTSELAKIRDVQSQTALAGGTQSGFGGTINQGSVGQVHVFLQDDHTGTTDQWATRFGAMARKLAPGAQIVSVAATGFGGGSTQQIDYLVTSNDDAPEKYVPKVIAALQNTPGAIAVNSSALQLAPQVDIDFDRDRARAFNINIGTAASAIRAAFGGTLAAQIQTSHGIKYVQVLYPRSYQTSIAMLLALPLRTSGGSIVHLVDIAKLVEDPSEALMTRTNRETVVHVQANLAPGVALSTVQDQFMKNLAAQGLPNTVQVKPNVGGNQQNLSDTVVGLGAGLLLSFLLVYLLMLALYNSYRLPFIIMFAVPVATVGALLSLALTRLNLNLYSLIGTVLLVGLASKNGILLVDFANHMVENGMDRVSAMIESAKERFRPIIMTTCAMIAGMTPIALALDPGGAQRQALGVVVIGGLISSLLLTLVLVPVIFMWLGPTPPPKEAEAA